MDAEQSLRAFACQMAPLPRRVSVAGKARLAKISEKAKSKKPVVDGAATDVEEDAPQSIPFVNYPDTLKPMRYDDDIFRTRPEYQPYVLRKPREKPLDPEVDDLVAYIYSGYSDNAGSTRTEIFMYGSTIDGETLCLRMNDFLPYCYVALPTEYLEVYTSAEDQIRLTRTLHRHLAMALKRFVNENEDLRRRFGMKYKDRPMLEALSLESELDHYLQDARDLKMYNRETRRLLKITAAEPSLIPYIKELLWFPEGWDFERCSVCQFNCRYGVQERDRPEPVLKHHKNCPAVIHESCAALHGEQRKAQSYLDLKWFSDCHYCTGYYSRIRLSKAGSQELEFKSLRDSIYGENEVHLYHDWISDFRKETEEYGKPLGRPLAVAMDDWLLRARIEKHGHMPQPSSFTVYSADIPYTSRAMADRKIAYSWIRVPARRWTRVQNKHSKTLAGVEAMCFWKNVFPHECSQMPEMLQMSLDEEMWTMGAKCRHEKDSLLQVPMAITNSRTGESKAVLFALGKLPETLGGNQVFSFPYETEEEMLEAERQMIREVCIFSAMVMANVVMTYNGTNFDIPYFIRRGMVLGVAEVRSFLSWRRGSEGDTRWRQDVLRGREITRITIKGVFFFDVYYWALKKLNGAELQTYELGTVAWLILRQKKNDVDASRTGVYQRTEAGRIILGSYAVQDVMLVQRICDTKKLLQSLFTEAAMLGVTPQDNCECGNNMLMGIALFRYATLEFFKEIGMMCVFPTPRKMLTHPDDKPDKYTGAVVIEPKRGYYRRPVATLDYSSLYPSIMREKNLCQSTFVPQEIIDWYNLTKEQFWQRPKHVFHEGRIEELEDDSNPRFLSPDTYYGFIPRFQKFMTDERKRVRSRAGGFESRLQTNVARLKNESLSAPEEETLKAENRVLENELAVIDVTQNSYKTLSNSVYGLMGLERSTYYRRAIAETITLTGQYAIMSGKTLAESHFTKANGYAGNLKVIYGDTDSIMCVLDDCDYEDHTGYLFSMMFALSAMIKKRFTVLDMQPEKLYLVYKLSGKKNYMGVKMDLTGTISTDIKGFKFKKKISSLIQRETCKYIYEEGLVGGDIDDAVAFVQKQLLRIHDREASIHDLAASGCFSKSFLGTTSHNGPMAAAQRMYDRTGQVVQTTERLRYIILEDESSITGRDCSNKNARAEQALYAEFNNLPYDAEHYKQDLIKTVIPLLLHLVPEKRGGHDEALLKKLLLNHPRLRAKSRRAVTSESTLVKAFSFGGIQATTVSSTCSECGGVVERGSLGGAAARPLKRPYVQVECESADASVGNKRPRDAPDDAMSKRRQMNDGAPCVPEPPTRLEKMIAEFRARRADTGSYIINHLEQNPEEEIIMQCAGEASKFVLCSACIRGDNGDLPKLHRDKYNRVFQEMVTRWNECSGCTYGLISGTSLTNCINDNCPNWDKRRKATKAYLSESRVLCELYD